MKHRLQLSAFFAVTILLSLTAHRSLAQITNDTVSVPILAGNTFYDICSSSDPANLVTGSFHFNNVASVNITVPEGTCLLDSTFTPMGANPTTSNHNTTYQVTLPSGSGNYTFYIDFTNINCSFFSNLSQAALVSINAWTSLPIAINRPILNFQLPTYSATTFIKGRSYSRSFTLDPGQIADYNQFAIHAEIETEIIVTRVAITFIGLGISDTIDIHQISCADLPDHAQNFLNNDSQLYQLTFAKLSQNVIADVEIPAAFNDTHAVLVQEYFTVISVASNNPSSSYVISSNACEGVILDICGDSLDVCTNVQPGFLNVACPPTGSCISNGAGNMQGNFINIDVYDSGATFCFGFINHAGVANPTLDQRLRLGQRIYGGHFTIGDTTLFDINNPANITVASYDSTTGTTQLLNPQPEITFIPNGTGKIINVCFKNTLGADPDGLGVGLTNVYTDPTKPANQQYYCDLLGNDQLLFFFDSIRFNGNHPSLHDCVLNNLHFLDYFRSERTFAANTDLCVDPGRQIHQQVLANICDFDSNAHNILEYAGGGVVQGRGFAGNTTSSSDHADIVQNGGGLGYPIVNMSFSFDQLNNFDPWSLSGPIQGCGNGIYDQDNLITNLHTVTYYAHIEIPAGFQITGFIYITDGVILDSVAVPFYTPHVCNVYNIPFGANLNTPSATIRFAVQMDGCPSNFTDSCDCSMVDFQPGNNFGTVTFCVQFRAQLNNLITNHQFDPNAFYNVYGCADRELFYHCSGGCNGLEVGIDSLILRRNTYGWATSNDYITGVAPLNHLSAGVDTERVCIDDEIHAFSTGAINATLSCHNFFNFELDYESPNGVANVLRFDSALITFKTPGRKRDTLILNGGNVNTVWTTTTVDPTAPTAGNSYLAVNIDMAQVVLDSPYYSTLQTLVNTVDSTILISIEAIYTVNCSTASALAPFHYEIQQIRSQYLLDNDSTCYSYSCDPWGDNINLIILRTEVGSGLYPAYGGPGFYYLNLASSRLCNLKYGLYYYTTGGYTLADDFPNEYRPIVDFPQTFSFDISNNLYLQHVQHRKLRFTNLETATGTAAPTRFNLFSLNDCTIDHCPDLLGGPTNHPGGALNFHYDSSSNHIEMNGNDDFSDSLLTDTYWLVSEKGDERYFLFELTRDCFDPDYTVPFVVSDIQIPLQFRNTSVTTILNGVTAPNQCLDTFATIDTFSYVNSATNGTDTLTVSLTPQQAPYVSNGNQVKFCASFVTQGIRTCWIRCTTPGAQITSIARVTNTNPPCATCPVGCTTAPMEQNAFGLHYFDCDAFGNQQLIITIDFTCIPNGAQGYNQSVINLEYGYFCNRCVIDSLNPDDASDYAQLVGCGGAKTVPVRVTPVAPTLALSATPTSTTYEFCNPAVIDIDYELTAGQLDSATLNVVSYEFDSLGWYTFIFDGDTLTGVPGDTILHFVIVAPLDSTMEASFIYFPGCDAYNNTTQDFAFSISGLDGCDSAVAFQGNTVSVLFAAGEDPFIAMYVDSLGPIGCEDSLHYELTITYQPGFVGNIELQICPDAFYAAGSVSSNYPFTQGACIDWIIAADSSGQTVVTLDLVSLDNLCDDYEIPASVNFVSNCYGDEFCAVGSPHSILSEVNVCCDTCNFEFELDDIGVCDDDSIPCINAPPGYTFIQITHNGNVVATSGTVYCPTEDGQYVVTIGMCGCVYTDTLDVVVVASELSLDSWLSDTTVTFCDTIQLDVVIENTGNYAIDDLWLNVKIPTGYTFVPGLSTYSCSVAAPPAGSLPAPTGLNGAYTYWDLAAIIFGGNAYPALPLTAPIYVTMHFVPPACSTGTTFFETMASGSALPCDSSIVSCKIKSNVHVHNPATNPSIALTGPASLGCNQTGAYQYTINNISPLFTGTLDFQICLPAGICSISAGIAPSLVIGNCYYWFIPVSGITSYTFNFNLTSCNFTTCQNYVLQTRFDMKGEIKCCATCTPCPWETAFMYLNKTINVCCCNYAYDLPATISACESQAFPCYTAPSGFIITQVYYNWTLVASNVYTYCPTLPGTYCYKIKHLTTGCQYSDCTVYQYVECPCDLNADWNSNQDGNCGIQFDDVTTMSSGSIIGWHWDFGDGTTSTLPDPYHVYQTQGSYTVCLTIYGLDGELCCQETYCQEIFVECEPGDCMADANWYYQMYNCDCALGFGANTNQAGLVSYYWDFGDGNTSTLPYPTHVYAQPGSYDVCLTVVTIQGDECCTDRYCEKVEVDCGHGYAESAAAAAPEEPEPCADCPCSIEPSWESAQQENCSVTFNDVSQITSGTIVGWFWDFGDGTTSTDPNPTHIYAQSGSYVVCLTVVGLNGDQCCFNTVCNEIWVECEAVCAPEPWMEHTLRECNCFMYFEGHNNHPSANAYYFWDFGDGFTSTDQNSVHGYQQPGAYTVCLTVVEFIGDECCIATTCEEIWVECASDEKSPRMDSDVNVSLSVAPNPFDDQTQISFALPHKMQVSLRVTNLLGEVVQIFYVNETLDVGRHTVEFATGNLPAGIYVCELNDGVNQQQIRMVIQR